MNWVMFFLGIILFAAGTIATILLSTCALPLRREPAPPHFFIRTHRQPGETDGDVYDRLLSESPAHQQQMKEGK